MRNLLSMALIFWALILASCSYSVHDDGNGLVVGLDNHDCQDKVLSGVTIGVFSAGGGIVGYYHFTDAAALASEVLQLDAGNYTIVAVVNVDMNEVPYTSLILLQEWLLQKYGDDEDMVSGMAVAHVGVAGITRVSVPLVKGVFAMAPLRLMFTLPGTVLPDYEMNSRSVSGGFMLRSVVELIDQENGEVSLRRELNPMPMSDGRYLVEIDAPCGSFGLRLWADHTHPDQPLGDHLYDTGNLAMVSLLTEPYQAGASLRDAAYYFSHITHGADGTQLEMALTRPVAKYRIIAVDVKRYEEMRSKSPERYPPVDELLIEVRYEYFFPSAFNVSTGKPSDSVTGVFYCSTACDAVGFAPEDAVMIAHDCVLTNGSDSFVSLTLIVKDKLGAVVSSSSGVKVEYRRGHLTTIKGGFLTAGHSSGGVIVDTEWEDDIIIEF